MIGADRGLPLPMEGALPPDLQGMLFRIGPGVGAGANGDGSAEPGDDPVPARGALHAIELRDEQAVSYLRRASPADAGVLWHAGSVLALPESGIPARYSRFLELEEFTGGLTVPIASHVHRDAADGSRVLFSVDDEADTDEDADGGGGGVWLRIGEWDSAGALRRGFALELERATWQHDIGLSQDHVVFIESPTERLADPGDAAVPFRWVPGAEGWLGTVRRDGDGSSVRWARLDPCLVTHVLGAHEVTVEARTSGSAGREAQDEIVLYVCAYAAPEQGQRVDRNASVVGPAGVGLTSIGGGLGALERWRMAGDRVERTQLDDRAVEYPRQDARCEGTSVRHAYCVEIAWDSDDAPTGSGGSGGSGAGKLPGAVVEAGCHSIGLLKFDLGRDEVAAWSPGDGRWCSEPIFVRAADGHGDDEGWLLTVVDDPDRHASDLYVLDASALGSRRPEAVIHLPKRLPPRSHGEWVPADRYR